MKKSPSLGDTFEEDDTEILFTEALQDVDAALLDALVVESRASSAAPNSVSASDPFALRGTRRTSDGVGGGASATGDSDEDGSSSMEGSGAAGGGSSVAGGFPSAPSSSASTREVLQALAADDTVAAAFAASLRAHRADGHWNVWRALNDVRSVEGSAGKEANEGAGNLINANPTCLLPPTRAELTRLLRVYPVPNVTLLTRAIETGLEELEAFFHSKGLLKNAAAFFHQQQPSSTSTSPAKTPRSGTPSAPTSNPPSARGPNASASASSSRRGSATAASQFASLTSDEAFFECPSVTAVGDQAAVLLTGRAPSATQPVSTSLQCVVCDAGGCLVSVGDTPPDEGTVAGVVLVYAQDQAQSFKSLQQLVAGRTFDCPVVVASLYPGRALKVPQEVSQKWCEEHGFIGPVSADPFDGGAGLRQVLSALGSEINKLMDRKPFGLAAGAVEAVYQAGQSNWNPSSEAVSLAGGERLAVSTILPGGFFHAQKGQQALYLPLMSGDFSFVSKLTCKAVTSSVHQQSQWWLSFSSGDFIHVLIRGFLGRTWMGYSRGKVGLFSVTSTDADSTEIVAAPRQRRLSWAVGSSKESAEGLGIVKALASGGAMLGRSRGGGPIAPTETSKPLLSVGVDAPSPASSSAGTLGGSAPLPSAVTKDRASPNPAASNANAMASAASSASVMSATLSVSSASAGALNAAAASANSYQLLSEFQDDLRVNELFNLMTDPGSGLSREMKRKAKGRKLKKPMIQCWEAREAVSWLVDNCELSRAQAVAKMQQLVDEFLVYNVMNPGVDNTFLDDSDLWRFWCDGTAPPLNVKVYLTRFVPVRHPLFVVKQLLEVALNAVVPCVRVTSNSVELDYFRLREVRRWSEFEVGVCELQRVHLNSLETDDMKMCFWINLHNLLAIHSSVSNKGMVASGWKGGFFTDSSYLLQGSAISLFQIHSGILRQNSRVNPFGVQPFQPTEQWNGYLVNVLDPRCLFAVSGCFRDSPAIIPLAPAYLNETLNELTTEYLEEHVHVDFTNCVVTLPGIMGPFAKDFGKDNAQVLLWVSKYLPSEKKSLVACLAQQDATVVRYSDIAFDLYPPKQTNAK